MRRLALLIACALSPLAAGCGDEADSGPGANGAEPPAAGPATSADVPGAVTAAPTGAGTIPLEIAAVVGDRGYQVTGVGECTHTTDASIYGIPAGQWRASYTGGGGDGIRSLNLTIWQPAAGGTDQANLSVRVGTGTHALATVQGGQMVGRGTAEVGRLGDGATLTVAGEDGEGTPLRVTVACAGVGEPVAEGG